MAYGAHLLEDYAQTSVPLSRGLDIAGQRFNSLVAIKRVGAQSGNATWLCRCDCGGAAIAQLTELRYGKRRTCGDRAAHSPFHSVDAITTRFWENVTRRGPDECWLWTGYSVGAYGQLKVKGKRVQAHRFSYEHHHGPIPARHLVRHKCDTPLCVNPSHLETGTNADNALDKVLRGRCCSILTYESVAQIKEMIRGGATNSDIAPKFGVTVSTISMIRNGRQWKQVP